MPHKSHMNLLNVIVVLSMVFSQLGYVIMPFPSTQSYITAQPAFASPQIDNSNLTCSSSASNVTITTVDDANASFESSDIAANQPMISAGSANIYADSRNGNQLLPSSGIQELPWQHENDEAQNLNNNPSKNTFISGSHKRSSAISQHNSNKELSKNTVDTFSFPINSLELINTQGITLPISYGQTVTGTIVSGDVDSYSFTATDGDGVWMSLSADNIHFDSQVRLYDTSGNVLEDWTGGSHLEVTHTFTQTANYHLTIGDNGGTDEANYTFNFQRLNPPVNTNPISYGDTTTDAISMATEVDFYTFPATDGDVVWMSLSADNIHFDSQVRLYDTSGNVLEDWTGGSHLEVTHTFTQTANYHLTIGDNGGWDQANYTFNFQRLNPPVNTNPISYGDTITDAISMATEVDFYTFPATDGDVVWMSLSADNIHFDSQVRLYDTNGNVLEDWTGGSHLEVTHTFTQTANYHLTIGDNGGWDQANYTFNFQRLNPPANTNPISYGDTITDAISMATEVDFYTFPATNGDVVWMSLSADNIHFDSQVRLYDTNGNVLEDWTGGSHLEVTHTFTQTANYHLTIGDNGGWDQANYGLFFQRLNGAGLATTLFNGQIITDSIDSLADHDSYVFTANDDTVFQIEVNRLSGYWEPYMRLFDPDGNEIAFSTDSPQTIISGTLATAGQYTLLVSDDGGTETGEYNISAILIGPQTLALGEVFVGSLNQNESHFFAVPVSNANQNILATITPLTNVNNLWAEGRFGAIPFFGDYDLRTTESTSQGSYELLISPSRAGTYYFSVFGRDINPSPGNYQIVVQTVDRHLSDVMPRTAGNAGDVTLNLTGLGFVEGMQVELRSDTLPTLTANDVTLASTTNLWAEFDLNGVAVADYDVVAIWPNSAEETLEDAFTITTGVGPCLEATIDAPDVVRLNRQYILWLEYTNSGDADMRAPLLIISGSDTVLFSLSPNGPYTTDPVQLLGINFDQPAGTLTPGSQFSTPIYFQVTTAGQAQFTLESMIADATAIDWAAMEVDVRPDDLDPDLWAIIWANFTMQMGATWADYLDVLDAQATYLAQYGTPIYDMQKIFSAIMGRASGNYLNQTLSSSQDAYSPARGIALEFSRVALDTLYQRFTVGPLGRGWSHNFEYVLTQPETDTVVIRSPEGGTRLFSLNEDGNWQASPGDYGVLQEVGGGIYQLREKDGQMWQFAAGGELTYIEESNGNRITLTYSSGNLTHISHSNGQSFTLAYNGQGRISRLTDHAGQITDYTYDASGELLLTVVAPGNVTTGYNYEAATGGADDYALTTITYPDNTHQYYAYDTQGRLSARWRDGNAERMEYAYDALGTIFVTDAFNAITTIHLGARGRPLALVDPLGNEARFQYDENFKLVQLTQPDGSTYEMAYDGLGNTIQVINPLVDATDMSYTSDLSRLDWLRDARGNVKDFAYDSDGNVTGISYPDGSNEAYAYDGDGNLTDSTNRRGDTITFTYNSLGQVTRKDYPDGSWIIYVYDAVGRLDTVTDASGVVDLNYDARGFLTRIEYPSGHWFTFAYNDAGQRTQRVGDDGYTLTYEYDAAGRLQRLIDDNSAEVIRYEYDVAGQLETEWKGNGTYSTYTYDDAGQLLSLVNYAPDDTVQSHFDYLYDTNGNRTSMTTLDGTTSYDYDTLGRVTHNISLDTNNVPLRTLFLTSLAKNVTKHKMCYVFHVQFKNWSRPERKNMPKHKMCHVFHDRFDNLSQSGHVFPAQT